MRLLTALFISMVFVACNNPSPKKELTGVNLELVQVADSISILMDNYHYNPSELKTQAYINIEKEVQKLAKTVVSKQEFIDGFNAIWHNGPFSHVRLAEMQQKAEDIATYVDGLNVGDQAVSLEWDDKTAVLTITTMTGIDTKENVVKAFKEISEKGAESLIVDLRNNTGGTFAGIPLIAHIVDKPADVGMFASQKYWNSSTTVPSIENVNEATPWEGWSLKSFWSDVQENSLTRVKIQPMEPQFEGPVYVLISNKTASAAEMTTDALAYGENVTIIGETTAGEMLSQKMFDLPSGLQLSLPIADYYSHRSGRIEGNGVQPDIEIHQGVAMDLAKSLVNKTPLEEALNEANSKLAKLDKQPFNGETLYLFGSMNDWGKKFNETPKFDYKGNGVFTTTAHFKKGNYEFKIAPMNWDFDFGATGTGGEMKLNHENALAKVAGSKNLTLTIEKQTELVFSLDVSSEEDSKLIISQK